MSALDSTQRFSDRVEHYVRSRPSYPEALFAFLRTELGLTAAWTVADIGSGTGISALPFLKNSNTLFAIEPNAPMRAAAEQMLAPYPLFRSINGTAEATTLPSSSIDLIVAAQAFHWFDPPKARQEFVRILRPRGYVALVWNDRRKNSTPFLADYENLLQQFGTDYNKVRHENIDAQTIGQFFAPCSFESKEFLNGQDFDYAGLKARLLSSSYTPAAGDPRRLAMLAHLRQIFDQHASAGKVAFEYDTRVYFGHLT